MYFVAGSPILTARAGCAAFALPQDYSPRRALFVGGRNEENLATTEVSTHDLDLREERR